VPRASIVWLARAVNVVRPATPRLHIDRARYAKGGRLGNTLGICMSGSEFTNNSKVRRELRRICVGHRMSRNAGQIAVAFGLHN
jgi:hypothetical protein